tara:strand:+ start:265 stop:423 length:159 start_codon:yes stop_codon:yes gene_type:complete
MEIYAGLVGVPLLIGFAALWCWLEERGKAKAKRKYDKQMAKYDTWRRINNGV